MAADAPDLVEVEVPMQLSSPAALTHGQARLRAGGRLLAVVGPQAAKAP